MKTKTLEELVSFYTYWPISRPAPTRLIYTPGNPGAQEGHSVLDKENQRNLYTRLKVERDEQIKLWGTPKPHILQNFARQWALGLHRRQLMEDGYLTEDMRFEDPDEEPEKRAEIYQIQGLSEQGKETDQGAEPA